MKIFITRHGRTDWNDLGKLQGQTNTELNDIGRQQAKDTGEQIKNEKIDLIIASPLKRAKETAEIINQNFNVDIIEDDRIMERTYNELEGITFDERKELIASESDLDYIWDYNKDIGLHDIESIKIFCDRIYDFLDDVIKKYKDKNVLIVTHGGTSLIMKYYFMKIPLEELHNRDTIDGLRNCEVIKFEV